MAINFEQSDIEYIVKNIITPVLLEYTKQLCELSDKLINNNNMLYDYQTEKFVELVDVIKNLRLINAKNIDFIKAVLFAHGLSNEECYDRYIAEWNKLNNIDSLEGQEVE